MRISSFRTAWHISFKSLAAGFFFQVANDPPEPLLDVGLSEPDAQDHGAEAGAARFRKAPAGLAAPPIASPKCRGAWHWGCRSISRVLQLGHDPHLLLNSTYVQTTFANFGPRADYCRERDSGPSGGSRINGGDGLSRLYRRPYTRCE